MLQRLEEQDALTNLPGDEWAWGLYCGIMLEAEAWDGGAPPPAAPVCEELTLTEDDLSVWLL